MRSEKDGIRPEEVSPKKRRRIPWDQIKDFFLPLLVIPFLPLILTLAGVAGVYRVIRGLWLGYLVKSRWYPKGKYVLFVYSNSPHWKEYIETNILPRIAVRSAVINWSDRTKWDWRRKTLELALFQHWTHVQRYALAGRVKWDGAEFNPVAIVFLPWWKPKVLRFWRPLKDFKHGRQGPLKELEAQLFESLSAVGR